jgi:ATP-dependent DNA ligase
VYGAYLLAVYNEEEEQFQTISKIGTGFSEVLLAQLSESLKPAIIPGPKSYYRCCSGKRSTWKPTCALCPSAACMLDTLSHVRDNCVKGSQLSAPRDQRSLLAARAACTVASAACAARM